MLASVAWIAGMSSEASCCPRPHRCSSDAVICMGFEIGRSAVPCKQQLPSISLSPVTLSFHQS